MDLVSMWEATSNNAKRREALKGKQTCDVTIIGAGFTGLSTALHLQEKGYQTIVLDSERVGFGASGRNGGELIPGPSGTTMRGLAEKVGIERAQQIWDITVEAIDLTENIIQKYEIDCDFVRNGDLRPAYKPSHLDSMKKDAEFIAAKFNYDKIEIIEKHDLVNELDTDFYHGVRLNLTGAHYHPLNYCLGLADAIERLQGKIYEKSKAISIEKNSKGKFVVNTKEGQVESEHVVIATNAYSGDLNQKIKRSVVPVESIMIATEPLDENFAKSLIKNNRAVSDSKNLLYYFRLTSDHRLAFGGSGRSSTSSGLSKMYRKLYEGMLKVFPQLKPYRIEYMWGGKVGFTQAMLPYIGVLENGIHFGIGYGGRGASLATMFGKILAEMIAGEKNINNPFQVKQLKEIPFHSQHTKAVGIIKYYKQLQDFLS